MIKEQHPPRMRGRWAPVHERIEHTQRRIDYYVAEIQKAKVEGYRELAKTLQNRLDSARRQMKRLMVEFEATI